MLPLCHSHLHLCLYVFLFVSSSEAANNSANAPQPLEKVVCVYPISGQYGLLSRLLYYSLLVFGIFARKQVWLVTGALASAMIYSSTSVFHLFMLFIISGRGQYDLDLSAAAVVAVTGMIAYRPVLDMSLTMILSPYRPIFGMWATIMTIGAFCWVGGTGFFRFRHGLIENVCTNTTSAILESPLQLQNSNFNCTYKCFSTTQLFRSPSEILAISKSRTYNGWLFACDMVCSIAFLTAGYQSLCGCVNPGLSKRTEHELRQILNTNPNGNETKKQMKKSKEKKKKAQRELDTGAIVKETDWGTYISPVTFVATIIAFEGYLAGLPSSEKSYAVGQWGPWVGICFAILAAWLNHRRKEKAKQKEEEDCGGGLCSYG